MRFADSRPSGNEEAVGRAIRASGIPREEIFVTTKQRSSHARCGNVKPANVVCRKMHHNHVVEGFEMSLKALDVGYIDL